MAMYIREDWELFRTLETLGQKAGVSSQQLGAVVAKELVDNALDVVGDMENWRVECGWLEYTLSFFVQDNGSGIDPALLPELFSIRRPLMSSKLLRLPTRGALGNGLRVVAGAVLATRGDLIVRTCGVSVRLVPRDDGHTDSEIIGTWDEPGTRIEVELPGILNHFSLDKAADAIRMSKGNFYKGRSSPHWYNGDDFHDLLRAAGDRPVRDLVSDLDGCTGAKAGQIAGDLLGRTCESVTRDESAELLKRARTMAKAVTHKRLGDIGEVPELGTYASVEVTITRNDGRGGVPAEIPFTIEVWAKRRSPSSSPDAFLFVNRTPSISDGIWALHKSRELVVACDEKRVATVKAETPYMLMINIITPYMPRTNDGKRPDLRPLADALEQAITKAIRRAKLNRREYESKVRTQKDIVFDEILQAVERVSESGRYRFSQRQLFYALRPALLEAKDNPDYGTFAKIITDYENAHGDIRGMYRDARGTLYHPHTGEDIPLGTIAVEDYTRPKWTFNKILYIEKEGVFPTLRAEKWAERHDCALLTSKGQASRAARDLLDLLGDTNEPITFYCAHDADAAGTMIYQALCEATPARGARSVHVVNLGLDPDEAEEMGLPVERATFKSKQPVADYARSWSGWLQHNRIELNAMTPAQLIAWLDTKMQAHNSQKVIPPDRVAADELKDRVEKLVRDEIQQAIMQETGYEERVTKAMWHIEHTHILPFSQYAGEYLSDDLNSDDVRSWRDSIATLARKIAEAA